ncbi:MAG: protein jag [Clostridia bacterium]|nr:protein jag [Clostridia bacterium]MBR2908705.1 protein jag [Clostridia bacterium]
MEKKVIISAKTTEEAISKAVEELGAPSADAVKVTVLEEATKGFLGLGAKQAKIEAVYKLGNEYCALEFVKQLLADMEISAEVRMQDGDNDDKLITIEGDGAGALIGHHGDTLDSLQYLANLAANKKQPGEKREYVKITIDIEGYRRKREETLRALARRKAELVLKYKKSIMLEPMTPYERRIIHSEVQNISGVSTNSIGSENSRKVVLYLDETASAETDSYGFDEE